MGRVAQILRSAAELVSAAIFASLFGVMVTGVVLRYAFDRPAAWVDEAAVVLFLWSIFWTAAFVSRDRDQVSFELLYVVLPPGPKRWTAGLGALAVGLLFLTALPVVVDYLLFLWRERTSVLELRLDRVYACFALFLGAAALRLLTRSWRMASPSWREHL